MKLLIIKNVFEIIRRYSVMLFKKLFRFNFSQIDAAKIVENFFKFKGALNQMKVLKLN